MSQNVYSCARALCARVERVVRASCARCARASCVARAEFAARHGRGRPVILSVTSGRVRLTCVRAPEEIIFIIII